VSLLVLAIGLSNLLLQFIALFSQILEHAGHGFVLLTVIGQRQVALHLC
jgi:hypothetical protein